MDEITAGAFAASGPLPWGEKRPVALGGHLKMPPGSSLGSPPAVLKGKPRGKPPLLPGGDASPRLVSGPPLLSCKPYRGLGTLSEEPPIFWGSGNSPIKWVENGPEEPPVTPAEQPGASWVTVPLLLPIKRIKERKLEICRAPLHLVWSN